MRSRSRSKRSKSRSKKSKSRSKTRTNLPMCPSQLYCGKYDKLPNSNYDRNGSRDECLKKGMGVGMLIQFNKIKNRLQDKGIILVTKSRPKEKCIDKFGNIKTIYSKHK